MRYEEHSGYFPGPCGDLYGTLYLPEVLAGETAIVLAEPFGEEKKCAYRMLVRLARALASHGVPTLRFDPTGSGDSPGDHGTVDFTTWCGDLRAAAEHVLSLAGVTGWAPIGARFGALPSLQVAGAVPPRAVILLEPVLSGNEFLRDLERRQKIKDMMSGQRNDNGPDAASRWEAGETVDFGGFPVSAAMAEQVADVEMSSLLTGLPATCALQVVRVSGSKKLPPAWQPLVDAADARETGEVTVVQDKPFWGQLEYYESDAVIDAVLPFLGRVLHLPSVNVGEQNS
jgi:exosortase A-associated hydrolase 2